MKKKHIAPFALLACAGAASAQSGVTLYGVVDTNIEYATNLPGATSGSSGNRVSMQSGGLSGSRWGMRGVEDLGGGLSALFVLESGFASDTGQSQQGGRLFGRQAYVGLKSSTVGQFTFGRQYTTLFDVMEKYSPTGAYSTLYEPAGAIVGLNFRENSVVKYRFETGPLAVQAHYALGGTPGTFQTSAAYGAGFDYASGPLSFAAAYDNVNGSQLSNVTHFRRYSAAAMLALGRAEWIVGLTEGNGNVTTPLVVTRYTFLWTGVRYRLSERLQAIGAFYYENVRAQNPSPGQPAPQLTNPQQVTLQLNYFPSKTTTLYLAAGAARRAALDFDNYNYSFLHYSLASGRAVSTGVALGMRKLF